MSTDNRRGEYAKRHQRIPTGELLASIHALADELGRTPKAAEYQNQGLYSLSPIRRRFGGWNAALDAAGLERNAEYAISEDRLIADLLRVAEDLGETPTRREYREHGLYADTAFQRAFGSWENATTEAGLEVKGCRWSGGAAVLRELAESGGGP